MLNENITHIFWDWDGTLCLQHYFWPQSRQTDKEIMKLNAIWQQPETAGKWMRGEKNLEQLRQDCGCKLTYKQLADRLIAEWPDEATINKPLFSTVQQLFPQAKHIITTDNMDIFNEYAAQSPFMRDTIDVIVNSCDYHAFKAGVPSLFDYARDVLKLKNFKHVLLIDDSRPACDAFIKLGGQAVNVTRNERL